MIETMLEQIRSYLRKTPFVAFSIRTADGIEYFVPTGDHAWIGHSGRIYVEEDEGGVNFISPLLVTNVRIANEPSTAV